MNVVMLIIIKFSCSDFFELGENIAEYQVSRNIYWRYHLVNHMALKVGYLGKFFVKFKV